MAYITFNDNENRLFGTMLKTDWDNLSESDKNAFIGDAIWAQTEIESDLEMEGFIRKIVSINDGEKIIVIDNKKYIISELEEKESKKRAALAESQGIDPPVEGTPVGGIIPDNIP
jgi:hypothetical protein